MNKIELPEAIAAAYEFETEPQSDVVIVGAPVKKQIIFSRITAAQAAELAAAGKYLKKKATAAKADKK
jgi:hypothetical protein